MLLKDYPQGYDLTLMNTMFRFGEKDPITDKWTESSIDLIIKDNHTGDKFVEHIENPDYEFYISKEELPHHMFFIDKDECEKIVVPYKNVLRTIADLTGNTNMFFENIRNGLSKANKILHQHPRVFLSDMDIEDHYMFRFARDYTNSINPISKAFFDIEVDSINMMGDFPEFGECPVNAISLIDESNNMVYVFFLRNEANPLIEEFEKSIGPELIKELKEFLTNAVGGWKQAHRFGIDSLDFKFLAYDEKDEIKLIADLFRAINILKPDFVLAWNMGFDIPYIIERIKALGYDPKDIMCHPDFPVKEAYYVIDEKNKNEFAERNDFARISSYSVFLDQLIQFASRRKGQSAVKSYSLDDIGDMVAGVRKLSYKHITTKIAELPYKDYKTFIFYNIMDTIVQKCIEKKTGDIDFVFNKAITNNTRYSKIHRQTVYLANRAIAHFYSLGYVMGNNINGNNKPVKFAGAFVADPKKASNYSRIKVNGIPINAYNNLNDFDYNRLYPSITQEFNMAPNTQYGKVTIVDQMDPNENRFNSDVWERQIQYMEDLQSNVYIEFCHRWLGLASYSELIDDILEYFYTVRMSQRPIQVFNTEGKIKPFESIPVDGKLNPFIHMDNIIVKPFEHYYPLDLSLKEKVINAVNSTNRF